MPKSKRGRAEEEAGDAPKKKKLKVAKASEENDEAEKSSKDEGSANNNGGAATADTKENSVLVVDTKSGRRFAVLLKITKVQAKVAWLEPGKSEDKFTVYTRGVQNQVNRKHIIKALGLTCTGQSVKIASKLIDLYIMEPGSQLPPPTNTNRPKKQSFEIDLSMHPDDKKSSLLTSRNLTTTDILGYTHEDCFSGDTAAERCWQFVLWANMYGFIEKPKDESGSNNGKTATEYYVYIKLLLYLLSSTTVTEEQESTKRKILQPFNKAADPAKYIIYSKQYYLETLITYLQISKNAWNSSVTKLKERGMIYIADGEFFQQNTVSLIIPPVVPTAKLRSAKRIEEVVEIDQEEDQEDNEEEEEEEEEEE